MVICAKDMIAKRAKCRHESENDHHDHHYRGDVGVGGPLVGGVGRRVYIPKVPRKCETNPVKVKIHCEIFV